MHCTASLVMRHWGVSRFVFFVGKGGVGKTTVSAAYALHRAGSRPKKPILLLSTDPAHSLADVLQQRLSDRPSRLKSRGQLWARQLDAQKELSRFLRAERQELLALLSKGSLFTAEEIEPFLDASLPGMAELAGLLAVHRLRESKFSEVVIDTAPIGHTLRLFHMPEHLVRFVRLLETAASRDEILAAQFGGHVSKEPALERWGEMLAQVKSAFAQEQAELVLVTTPEPFALSQSRRAEDSLKSGSWPRPFSRIVLNRAIRSRAKCALCQRRSQQTQVAYDWLRKKFPTAAILTGIDPGVPILGVKALASFGEHVFRGVRLPNSVLPAPDPSPAFKLVKAEWPQLRVPLTLSVGKGGVGKTTISVALAFRSRQQKSRIPVNICSVDQAPSLDDAFQTRVTDRLRPVLDDEGLRAAEMDAGAEFECWAGTLRDTISEALSFDQGGLHLDLQFERQFLLALLDVVPPGVD